MAVSVSAGLFLVVRFLFDWRAAVVIAGGIAALSVLTWLVRPAHDRRQANERNLR